MKVLVDTNILMDFVLKRPDFVEKATSVIDICSDDQGDVEGYVSAHSLMDLCFLVRKVKTRQEIIDLLKNLSNIFAVVETTSDRITAAAERMDSDVPIISPTDFVKLFKENEAPK